MTGEEVPIKPGNADGGLARERAREIALLAASARSAGPLLARRGNIGARRGRIG